MWLSTRKSFFKEGLVKDEEMKEMDGEKLMVSVCATQLKRRIAWDEMKRSNQIIANIWISHKRQGMDEF